LLEAVDKVDIGVHLSTHRAMVQALKKELNKSNSCDQRDL